MREANQGMGGRAEGNASLDYPEARERSGTMGLVLMAAVLVFDIFWWIRR
jgi:hypothetical protein